MEELEKFVTDGYKTEQGQPIPKRLAGFELYLKQFMKFMESLGDAVEMLLNKVGLETFSRGFKLSLGASFFLIPCFLMIYLSFCMKEDEVYEADEVHKEEVKPASSGKRFDKID